MRSLTSQKISAVKLRINGEYWDSQIYSNELYLFTEKESIVKIDWRSYIDSIASKHAQLQTAIRVSFSDGDLFYNNKVRKILMDPDIRGSIEYQLTDLSRVSLSTPALDKANSTERASPFSSLIVDSDIYYGAIIAATREGLFTFKTSKFLSRTFSPAIKHHDASFLQVKASDSVTSIAAAVGSDGLFEFGFDPSERDEVVKKPKILSGRSCKTCDWSFNSIMGFSETQAFLAKFDKIESKGINARVFDKVVDLSIVFNEASTEGYTIDGGMWGSREKLYRFSSEGIHVVQLGKSEDRRSRENGRGVDDVDSLYRGVNRVQFSEDEVISTGMAPFGTVIELSDRILVLRSDGHSDEFPGEPVHWRVFPRSSHYSNQLHIIYEDYMEIVSFVHDYFVDQDQKVYGFSKGATHGSGEWERHFH